ncbi:MAG: cytochrome c family protein [Anaerolineae bacterium]|nr:cytochrome c family protein [Anaerolineae bacterium]
MRRLSIFALIFGIALITLATLDWNTDSSVAHAQLPDDHPSIAVTQVPTTPNDFFLPGTQPAELEDDIAPPSQCIACHKNYSSAIDMPEEHETWRAWSGSMMAQAGRDPVFWAALDIANADASFAGDFCLRCHLPTAFMNGDVTQNSTIDDFTPNQLEGVQCEVCHRLVDPVYKAGISPERDLAVLEDIDPPVLLSQSGSYIIDPVDERRGPFDLSLDYTTSPHTGQCSENVEGYPECWPLQSPYHQQAALCGTCHDITNPAFTWDDNAGEYVLNDLDTPSDLVDGFPIERTYSEWLLSDYNTQAGIFAPQFGGNKTFVSTCQDCHMRDTTGMAGYIGLEVIRNDMPLHDLTGANTWVPTTLPLHPNPTISGAFDTATDPLGADRLEALQRGIERARYMLENAAEVTATVGDGNQLTVKVVNNSGHKLPSGYAEGRRMWLQIEGYDADGNLIYSSGAYNIATGDLTYDSDIMIYEAKQGMTESLAAQVGLPPGESFHFVLNNVIVKDNRIPPRGYEFDAFAAAGAAPMTKSNPDPTRYADGQYWDEVVYELPDEVVTGVVRLLFQASSKEYIEFLRDNNPNPGDPDNNGAILFDLWEQTERSKPEVMAEISFGGSQVYLPAVLK